MERDWSQEIRREYSGGEARFDLPVRPLGAMRWVGVFTVGFGLLFVWIPARDICHTIQRWLQAPPGGAETFFSLFELPFLIAGCVPIAVGLLILFGRCRVQWKDGRLQAAEILGPLRWTRRLPAKPVGKLEVSAASSRSGTAAPREIARFSVLAVLFEDGSRKIIVLGYPKDWLLPLAQELSSYASGAPFSASAAQVEVVETSPQDATVADVIEQPPASQIQVEEHATGVRLTVPPAGIWRGSKGLFFFALLWCGFMVVFSTVMALPGVEKESPEWMLILFLLGFWAVGLGMMAIAINMGRRTADFLAESGRLRVETKSLFGAKQQEWSRAELAAIRADAGGMEVNDRPVIELQIHPRAGKKAGYLAGRNEDELRWMATRLRRALNVPAR